MSKYYFLFIANFVIGCSATKTNSKAGAIDYDKYFSNDSFQFWDFSNRGGWLFIRDHKLIEYNYDNLGDRVRENYGGDIIADTINWEMTHDTFIYYYKSNFEKVIELTNNRVVFRTIKPLYKEFRTDTTIISILTRSIDQETTVKIVK